MGEERYLGKLASIDCLNNINIGRSIYRKSGVNQETNFHRSYIKSMYINRYRGRARETKSGRRVSLIIHSYSLLGCCITSNNVYCFNYEQFLEISSWFPTISDDVHRFYEQFFEISYYIERCISILTIERFLISIPISTLIFYYIERLTSILSTERHTL